MISKSIMRTFSAVAIVLILLISVIPNSANASSKVSLNQDFNSMQIFIKALNSYGVICNPYKKNAEVLIVTEEGVCKTPSGDLTLDIFPTDKVMNQVIGSEASMMKSFGATYTANKNWSIVVFSVATGNSVSKLLRLEFKNS